MVTHVVYSPELQTPRRLLVKATMGFLRFIRNKRATTGSREQIEHDICNIWNSYYVNALQYAVITDDRLELLKQAAISVKYHLERQFEPHELDYDISCACVLFDPFELHVDITPKHTRCLATIASVYLH